MLLILLLCLLYLPFLNQAFHIDDAGFIALARSTDWNPLAPEAQGSAQGVYGSTHTVFLPYFMKIIAALFGEREVAFHLVFLIFPIIVIFSLVRLNDLWFPDSRNSSAYLLLFFVSIPVFLVSSHTVMSDVPTLAFLLLSVFFFATAMEKNAPLLHYAGGLSLTLAIFTSYQMLVFVPLLFIYAWMKKKLDIHVILGLVMPVVLLSACFLIIYKLYHYFPISMGDFAGQGRGVAAEIKRGLLSEVFFGKVINIFATIGASLFFVQLFRYFMNRSFTKLLLRLLILTPVCSIVLFNAIHYSVPETILLSFLTAQGILSLVDVTRSGLNAMNGGQRPRNIFLLLWVYTVIGYNVFLMPFGAARYLLPAFPPMLFIFMSASAAPVQEKKSSSVVSFTLFLSVSFGLASAYSDYRYAETYREFTREVEAFRSSSAHPFTVWYIGKWGMQYYMDRAGFRLLPPDSEEPKKGDFVIVPEIPRFWEPSLNVIQRLKFYATREYRSRLPLRLFNRGSNAGFYAHHWGLLPFSFSRRPDELFQIWEVVR